MVKATTYYLFDTKNIKWLWRGSEEELLQILKVDNKSIENVSDATFKGYNLFKKSEPDESVFHSLIAYFSRSESITVSFGEYDSLMYSTKPSIFYKLEGQTLIEVDVFTLLGKSGVTKATHFATDSYTPQARNGPVENVGKNYKFGKYYRRPQQSGMRKELSRYKEDKEYIPTLTRQDNIPSVWDDNPRQLSRSWKDNNVRHQWQKNLKLL